MSDFTKALEELRAAPRMDELWTGEVLMHCGGGLSPKTVSTIERALILADAQEPEAGEG